MTKRDDGGPAFPLESMAAGYYGGMSLRDHFAGLAMQALLAAETTYADTTMQQAGGYNAALAEDAYETADAMLAERAKGAPDA